MFIQKKDTELQTERKLQKAGSVLCFTKNEVVNADIVKARFKALVQALHPDAAGVVHEFVPQHDIDAMRKAKDLLLQHMENDDA